MSGKQNLIRELKLINLGDLITKVTDGEFNGIHNHFPSRYLESVLRSMGQDALADRVQSGEFNEN